MLKHPTEERLAALGLTGMAKALEEQRKQPDIAALGFEERFALLVDREATERDNKRLKTRLRYASLRQNAVIEDVDTKTPRGLDRALFQMLADGGNTTATYREAHRLQRVRRFHEAVAVLQAQAFQHFIQDGARVLQVYLDHLPQQLEVAGGIDSLQLIQCLEIEDVGLAVFRCVAQARRRKTQYVVIPAGIR